MTCGVSCVDTALNKSFAKLGTFIGKHPGYFVIIPVLLTLLCITGYQQLDYEMDPEYLFSPIRGEGKTERAIVESYFKVNYTHRFSVGRITRPGRFGRVIVTTKDDVDNMLRKEVFQELRMLDQLIQNSTVYYDGDQFTYQDICAKWADQCFANDILNLDFLLDDYLSGNLNLTFPFMFNPVTWDAHAFPVFFGGTKLTEDSTIISVPALQMVYFVTTDTKRQDAKGAAWEDSFLELMGKLEDKNYFKHITIARFASRTLDHELEKNTRSVIPYFTSTFFFMAIFSVFTCVMGDTVRSKPWLGFFGNISALMATAAAFGLAMYLGIEFIGINLAAPFLMISIGIDDTFVMLAAWRRTSMKLSVPERMGLTMAEAAVSITITSLTDMVSFWIGIISPFPSVQIFCTYSGFAVCFIFIWHITFFAGCMAISGYCEEKNLHGTFGFKVQPMSVAIKENRSWLYRKLITGGINRDDPDNPLDNQDHMLMNFFRRKVSAFVNNGWIKAFIILIFALYLVGAGYGVTKIKEGLERRKLSKSDSYSVRFFDLEDDFYREFPYRIQVIIAGDLNYSDPMTQYQIEQLTQSLENTSYVTSSLYTESWLRSFLGFFDRNEDFINVTIDNEIDFINAVKQYWLLPTNTFSLDVKYNENETRILASRFLIQAVNITDTNHEKVMVKDLRKICHDSPLNATVFHPYFVFFDQFELVRPISIQSMIVGAIVMMIIAFIFIPNILCSLWVAFSIVSIELGVAGYMSLWDVNLDSISMINLIMCIGFSVDFTAHICYAYMSSTKRKPSERVEEALYSLGMPILQGSTSTIIGCLGLLLADSYIFLVFFKMIFLVILFGAMHGLFLLPVLLSLFGPGSCCPKKDEYDADEYFNVDTDLKKLKYFDKSFSYHNQHLQQHHHHHHHHLQQQQGFSIPHPQLTMNGQFIGGNNGNVVISNGNNSKFLGQPYKMYGVNNNGLIDDKDQGIGTSGEDSSESSSNKSQRRQAIEDENTRRRYEEGWRRSSHNLSINNNNNNNNNQLSGQQQNINQKSIDLYGTPNQNTDIWTTSGPPPMMERDLINYGYDDQNNMKLKYRRQNDYDQHNIINHRERDRRKSDEHYRYYYPDNEFMNNNDRRFYDDSNFYYPFENNRRNNNNININNNNNRYLIDNTNEIKRKFSDEKRLRKYTPPEGGIYRPNPNRSSSQHNLYYPRQQPHRSSSQHSLHQLRYINDTKFP